MKKIILFIAINLAFYQVKSQSEIFATDSLIIDSVEVGVGSSAGPLSTGSSGQAAVFDTNYKMVYWIHGLAGDESSWMRVAHALRDQGNYPLGSWFPERKAFSVNKAYNHLESSDLLNAGVDYADILDDEAQDPDYSQTERSAAFAIAHSQGGLVARSVRRANYSTDPTIHSPAVFHALATFGTPHKGAAIIDNTNNGKTQKWINEGCEKIARGEIQTFLNTKWWLDAIVSTKAVVDFSTKACEGLNKIALPILINSIRKPISNSYSTNALDLNTLDSISTLDTIPVVTFYGEEKEPVLWRTLNSMTLTPDSAITGAFLLSNPFGLNDDNEMPNFVNRKMNEYLNREFMHKYLAKMAIWSSRSRLRKASFYREARIWLLTANPVWKRLIGSRKDSSFIDGYWCDCWEASGPKGQYNYVRRRVFDPNNCGGPNSLHCSTTPLIKHVIIEEPSDGVVTKSSQKGYSGSLSVKMRNTNHMQERNCEETRVGLQDLFKGHYYRNFYLHEK